MNLSGSLHLGWACLKRQRAKTLLLAGALTLTAALPGAVTVLTSQAERQLRARAEATPLLLGARGSALELVFNGLYFSKPGISPLSSGQAAAAAGDGLAAVVPVHARFTARGHRVVGTSLDYFRFRQLEVAEGRLMTRLGDCVVGHAVARAEGLRPGDSLMTSPEAVFDLAGVYPLKMRVTGILAPSGSPDDRAVFVDVKTAWIIQGLGHGHEDAREADPSRVLGRSEDGASVALNAAVPEYNEVTEENAASFHFHGDPSDFPVTAAILWPRDERSRAILLGRYQDPERAGAQLVEPVAVMDELFDTVFQVQRLVLAALALVGGAALAIALLVFSLSHRLREREFRSLRQIGADSGTLRLLVAFEGAFVLAASLAAAFALVGALRMAAPALARHLVG